MDDNLYKSDAECIDILKYIFNDAMKLYKEIAPGGWINSEYIFLLHPTPEQKYKEHKRMMENINSITKKTKDKQREIDISDFKQDELTGIEEHKEFFYILGLVAYDIFSNNHEVIGEDRKAFNLGSFRGSGDFIAGFLNNHYPDKSDRYNYMDFYMGTIWIRERGVLMPFYEYVFKKLKDLKCDWVYSFPRTYVVDMKNSTDKSDDSKIEDYKPEESVHKDIESSAKDKQTNKLKEDLDNIYEEEYEEAKYTPLIQIVQAYKNIFGVLPEGHSQKEFE